MSTYKGTDNCTDAILDLISERESEGNYNAVIGNAKASDDLSLMTIGGIYGLQERLLSLGRPSTAVGRYQIIRTTLRNLQRSMSLALDARFTTKMQDDMAIKLMVGRGYKSWWRDAMSDEEFIHGLSCEWASLPDPYNGGKSHYDGVGPNHAGMTLNHVYDGLARARTLMPKGVL